MKAEFISNMRFSRLWYYPTNKEAQLLCKFANRATASESMIELLKEIGFEVVATYYDPDKDPKYPHR